MTRYCWDAFEKECLLDQDPRDAYYIETCNFTVQIVATVQKILRHHVQARGNTCCRSGSYMIVRFLEFLGYTHGAQVWILYTNIMQGN